MAKANEQKSKNTIKKRKKKKYRARKRQHRENQDKHKETQNAETQRRQKASGRLGRKNKWHVEQTVKKEKAKLEEREERMG